MWSRTSMTENHLLKRGLTNSMIKLYHQKSNIVVDIGSSHASSFESPQVRRQVEFYFYFPPTIFFTLSQVDLHLFVYKTRRVTWTLVIGYYDHLRQKSLIFYKLKGNGISGLVIFPRQLTSFATNALTILIAISIECVIRVAKNVNAMETIKTAYSIWVSLSSPRVFFQNDLSKISSFFPF